MQASNADRRVAVMDIGTNTLLLLIVEAREQGGRTVLAPVYDACRFGRLGKGLDQTGTLSDAAVARSLEIVREYKQRLDEHQVQAIRVVGTQALREAKNAAAFVTPATELLGVPIEVIAGEREAELVYRSVAESFPELRAEAFVVADVGGGSTEIIVADAGKVASFTSVPLGSVRLHERHLHADPPTPEQVTALTSDVDRILATLELPTGIPLIGTAGTATTIAAVDLKLRTYDPDRVQGYRLPPAAVERQLALYLERTVAERRALPGLEPERADVIAAGTAIFTRLLRKLSAPHFIVSDRGVRWGLAYELCDSLA